MRSCGIDFGTTNSVVALADDSGNVELAPIGPGGSATFRSLLFYEEGVRGPRGRPRPHCGPAAIERYLELDGEGRLMQSLKSFLASKHVTGTQVFGAEVTLETMIGELIGAMARAVESTLGKLPDRVVVGRPVRFAWTDSPDDPLPEERLIAAFASAGIHDVVVALEPVAAAYHFVGALGSGEHRVLIGDFGGGTSDFCALRVTDGVISVEGTHGVGLAGDSFDAALVDKAVAPLLGKGATYRSVFGRDMAVPDTIYRHLSRWHELSFLKSPRNMLMLHDYRRQMASPEMIGGLIHLVENNLGYALYREVGGTKVALSEQAVAPLSFEDDPLDIDIGVTRDAFEDWISDDVARLGATVDELLVQVGWSASDVERVYLTGGTAKVPSVYRLFSSRFGEGRVAVGDHHTSVAAGLARMAHDLDR